MLATGRTIHASAVLVGESAVVIRGPSGSGKSRLALGLIRLAEAGGALPFARLVGDDRVALAAASGRLLVSPAPNIAGLIEVRGLGVLPLPYEPLAVVGLIVDLAAEDGSRMPAAEQRPDQRVRRRGGAPSGRRRRRSAGPGGGPDRRPPPRAPGFPLGPPLALREPVRQ